MPLAYPRGRGRQTRCPRGVGRHFGVRRSASCRDCASSRPRRSQTSPCSSKRPSIEASARKRARTRVSSGSGLARQWIVSSRVGAGSELGHHAERRRPPGVGVEGDQLRRHRSVATGSQPATADRLVATAERCRAPDRSRLELLEERRRTRAAAEHLDRIRRRSLGRLRVPALRRLVVGGQHAEGERHRPAVLEQPRRAGRRRTAGTLDGHLDLGRAGRRRPQVMERHRARQALVVVHLGADRAQHQRRDEAAVGPRRAEPLGHDRPRPATGGEPGHRGVPGEAPLRDRCHAASLAGPAPADVCAAHPLPRRGGAADCAASA